VATGRQSSAFDGEGGAVASREVFRYMAYGWSNLEIAREMDLSTKTISITSQRIKDALGVHRPAQLTMLAINHGIIRVTQPWPSSHDAQAGLAIGSDGTLGGRRKAA
jgi:DNA-binding CsgD family transcriptional regulator